jgi:hypothetical protein
MGRGGLLGRGRLGLERRVLGLALRCPNGRSTLGGVLLMGERYLDMTLRSEISLPAGERNSLISV